MIMVIRVRATAAIVFTLLVWAVIPSNASGNLAASQVSWQEFFGSSKADTNALFCLMAHGYFRAPSTNVQNVIDAWLKKHRNAAVIPVRSFGPAFTKFPSSRFVYVWVEDGRDNLNLELVRHGCFDGDNEILSPDEKLEVSRKDYNAFLKKDFNLGNQAKKDKIGIWQYTWYSTNTEADLLKPHVVPGAGPNWLFVSGGHIDFNTDEVHRINDWLATHKTGWKFGSIDDFSPYKTQLSCEGCDIEIDADRIILSYEEHSGDPDTEITIKRALSPREQSFWETTVSQITMSNDSQGSKTITH